MNKLVLTALIAFLLYGCGLQERHYKKCLKWGMCGTDSLVIKDTVKTDTIVLDDSQVWMDMLFECDSSGDILIRHINNVESENADLKMQLHNNRFVAYINKPNDTIYRNNIMRSRTEIKTIKVPLPKTKWQQFATYWAIFTFLIIILYIIYRVRKFFMFLNKH